MQQVFQTDLSKPIFRPQAGYEQSLKFCTSVEELNERGKWTIHAFERSIRIYYVGEVGGDHKYQVFCPEAEFHFERTSEPYHVLLKRISFVFDEVVLSTDEKGTIIRLHNFPFLQYRWGQIKEKLSHDYDSDEFLLYVNTMDILVADYEAVLEYFRLPSMFGLHFNGYWGIHPSQPYPPCPATFGKEAKNLIIEESMHCKVETNEAQQRVRLEILGKPYEKPVGEFKYKGQYTYLDGVLEHCNKTIDLGNRKINYSAKWHGLKNYFR